MSPQPDDDELVAGLDDDARVSAGDDQEFEQKLAEFMREVDKHINTIMKPKQFKAPQRLESVRMLGELGEIKAIKALVTVYHKDKTPGIKEAAAKSLGMFRALQEALEDNETSQYASDLLDGIVRRRALGKPARFQPETLRLVLIGLTVSLVVLFALGMVLAGAKSAGAAASAAELTAMAAQGTLPPTMVANIDPTTGNIIVTPTGQAEVASLLSDYYVALSQDISVLQTQLRAITREQTPDCTVTFLNPTAIVLPPNLTAASHPALAAAADTLTGAGIDVALVRDAFTVSCQGPQMSREEANTYDGNLTSVQTRLKDIPAQLTEAGVIVPPTATAMVPTEPPTNTPPPTDTPTPEPTTDPRIITTHKVGLQRIIDVMMGRNGHIVSLQSYWQDVVTTGTTAGCLTLPAPTLPENYVLPEDVGLLIPELAQAAVNVNTGLALARQSWQAFELGCNAKNLPTAAATQTQVAETARQAFAEAQANLDAIQSD